MVMNEWRFEHDGKQSALRFTPAMVCDDGALLRQWVLADAGIASKSWWDVKRDVEQGRLRLLFAESFIGFSRFDKKMSGCNLSIRSDACSRCRLPPSHSFLLTGWKMSRSCKWTEGKSGLFHWTRLPGTNKAENVRCLSYRRPHLMRSPVYPLLFRSPAAETLRVRLGLPFHWTVRERKRLDSLRSAQNH
jgi:hypothetical protein